MNCDICEQPCEDYYVGMSCVGITIMCAQCYNRNHKHKDNKQDGLLCTPSIPEDWFENYKKEMEKVLEPTVSQSNTNVIYDIIINSED